MSSYGYPGPGPEGPPAYASRDRFWSSPPGTGAGTGGGVPQDPWGSSGSYTPQLELTSFNNNNSSYIPYGQSPQPNGATNPSSSSSSSQGGDLNLAFSGPSPPNPTQLQPISYPPPSPCGSNGGSGRGQQYTPSSTPTPLTPPTSQKINGMNGSLSNHNNSSNSSNNSNSGSPPNGNNGRGGFTPYLEDQGSHQQGGLPNGHGGGSSSGSLLTLGPSSIKNEMMNGGGHPNGPPPPQGNGGGSDLYRNSNGGMGLPPHPADLYSQQYQNPQNYYGGNYGPSAASQTPSGSSSSGGYHHHHHPQQHHNPYSSYPGGGGGESYNKPPSSYDPYQPQPLYPPSNNQQPQNSYPPHQDEYGGYPHSSHPLQGPTSGSPPSSAERNNSKDGGGGGGGSSSPPKLLEGQNDPYPSSNNNYDATNQNSSSPRTPNSSSFGNYNSPPKDDNLLIITEKKPSPSSSSSTGSSKSPKTGNGKDTKGKNKAANNNNNNEDKEKGPPKDVAGTKDAKKKRKKRNKGSTSSSSSLPEVVGKNNGGGSSNSIKDPSSSSSSVEEFSTSSSTLGGLKIKEEPKDSSNGNKSSKNNNKVLKHEESSDHLLDPDDPADFLGGIVDDEDTGTSVGGKSTSTPTTTKDNSRDIQMVECGCFPADEVHAEPGPFYTHLGAGKDLVELRKLVEDRTGFRGSQVRLEKVIYSGKEGKSGVGCPIAKWILRRGSYEEQLLFLVKHRKGHKCNTAWIVVCVVIWEGVPPHFSDNLYDTLVYKLNRFGIPTTRRSDTNEQRSCACQGVDPDTCGAAYSFGCAWSMFFNGCKYARSRNVRKFRLTEEHEESELEEKVQHLATHLAPLYERVAPDSYTNQIDHENEGLECRLGYRPGRPFSGVTACVDYCSHAHKDAHNMMNGCTVSVSLARHRNLGKGDDEQYHVLPLYKLDDTDEYGSKEGQKAKVKKGQLEILKKFPCKVRIRKVPLLPSRRRAKAKTSSNSSGANSSSGGGGAVKSEPLTPSAPIIVPPSPSSKGGSSVTSLLGDYGDMPPLKREKLFDEGRLPPMPNGTMGDQYGDARFHGHYGQGPQQGSGLGHSFNDLGGPPPGGSSIWNQFGSSSSSPSSSRLPPSQSSSSSYFDHTSPQGGVGGGGQFGPGASSSLTSLTELTNSAIPRQTNLSSAMGGGSSGGSSSGPGSSSSSTVLSSPGNPGSASSSGYGSAMSPILPSFRNTFMPETEAGGGGAGGLQHSTSSPSDGSSTTANNNPTSSSPRSHSHMKSGSGGSNPSTITPAFQDPYGSSSSSSGLPPSSSSASSSYQNTYSTPPGGIYHPQPHNPCLPPPNPYGSSPYHDSSPYGMNHMNHPMNSPNFGMGPMPPSLSGWGGGGSPYSSNYGYSSYPSNFGMNPMNPMNSIPPPPPPLGQYSPYHHHHPHHQGHPHHGMNMNMNMPITSRQTHSSWGPPGNPLNPFNPPSMNPMSPMNPMSMIHSAQGGGGQQGQPPGVPPPPPSCFVTPPKPKVIPEVTETHSDNEDCFKDSQMGGVAIALTHGSVILQCAKHEMHATTALKNPNRMYPSRICLIFYQHKSMNNRFHGWSEWEKKIEAKKLQEVKLINQGKMEASPRKMKQLIKEGYIQE